MRRAGRVTGPEGLPIPAIYGDATLEGDSRRVSGRHRPQRRQPGLLLEFGAELLPKMLCAATPLRDVLAFVSDHNCESVGALVAVRV